MIPKIIHQIWIGSSEMPDREKKFCKKIKESHPDWDYIFWDNEKVSNLNPIFQKKIRLIAEKTQTPSFVVDYIKLVLLYEYGGVFLDVDFDIISSLNDLNLNKRLIVSRDDRPSGRYLQFGFAASTKKHEFIENILFNLKYKSNLLYLPTFFSKCFKEMYFHPIQNKYSVFLDFISGKNIYDDIEILDRSFFFKGKIAKHYNLHSHKPKKKTFV